MLHPENMSPPAHETFQRMILFQGELHPRRKDGYQWFDSFRDSPSEQKSERLLLKELRKKRLPTSKNEGIVELFIRLGVEDPPTS